MAAFFRTQQNIAIWKQIPELWLNTDSFYSAAFFIGVAFAAAKKYCSDWFRLCGLAHSLGLRKVLSSGWLRCWQRACGRVNRRVRPHWRTQHTRARRTDPTDVIFKPRWHSPVRLLHCYCTHTGRWLKPTWFFTTDQRQQYGRQISKNRWHSGFWIHRIPRRNRRNLCACFSVGVWP